MIKRLLDIFGSLFGLIVFSPLLLVLYIVIRRDMGGLDLGHHSIKAAH